MSQFTKDKQSKTNELVHQGISNYKVSTSLNLAFLTALCEGPLITCYFHLRVESDDTHKEVIRQNLSHTNWNLILNSFYIVHELDDA